MNEKWYVDLVKSNAGPLIFLAIAGTLAYFIPEAGDKTKALFMVIGAALTRVKVPAIK